MVYKKKAFTIVELLIIVVVIGILASVVLISFSNISQRAILSSLQSDLSNAKKQLQNYQTQNGVFPTQIACPASLTTDICIKPSGSNVFSYTSYNANENQPSFYLSVSNGSSTYHITDTTDPVDKSGTISNGLAYNLDFANNTSYPGNGTNTTDLVSGLGGSLSNPSYYSYDSVTKSMNFTRDSVTVTGGFHAITMTGNLTASNFLYNNHTMEIMAKINDYNGSNINGNESQNTLMVYRGWHSGFMYSTGGIYYGMWNGTSAPTFFLTTSPTANTWFHLVASRTGSTTRLYINGVFSNSSTYSTANGSPGVSNEFKLASANNGTGPYANYSKCNIAYAKLYTRALSAGEVAQNFNATRSRYGL